MHTEQVIRAIDGCNFLDTTLVEKWKVNLRNIPEEFHGLIYRTFLEAKRKVDGLYVQFELARDDDNKYRSLLHERITEIVKLLNRQRLTDLEIE